MKIDLETERALCPECGQAETMPSGSKDSDWFCSLCGFDFTEDDAAGMLTLEDTDTKTD